MATSVSAPPQRLHTRRGISLVDRPGDDTGGPVLLLHGIGGNADSCAQVADRLTAVGFRTLAWDAPGYGDSADPEQAVEAVDHAGEVITLLEELGLGPVHLVGTSWGGVIAAEATLRRPELVRSLTLADSTRGSGTRPDKAQAMRGRVAELAELGPRAFAATRAPRLVASGCPSHVAAAVEDGMGQVRVAGYAAAADHMARTDLGGVLPDLAVPTLVLVGEEDVVTGVAESRLLADLVPGARFVVVPEAGHAAIQERPGAVVEHLLGFWQEIAR
jgi:pimeloyl-ACP methyl ester carboxylesterase